MFSRTTIRKTATSKAAIRKIAITTTSGIRIRRAGIATRSSSMGL